MADQAKTYEIKASAKLVRIAPRKVRLVLDLIRNKSVGEALNIVSTTDKKASRVVFKLLKSAIANAEDLNDTHDCEIDIDNLYVRLAYANEGPTLKRFRPSAKGRASAINKRTSHITIVLDERKEA